MLRDELFKVGAILADPERLFRAKVLSIGYSWRGKQYTLELSGPKDYRDIWNDVPQDLLVSLGFHEVKEEETPDSIELDVKHLPKQYRAAFEPLIMISEALSRMDEDDVLIAREMGDLIRTACEDTLSNLTEEALEKAIQESLQFP
jgi:hypothetical protein